MVKKVRQTFWAVFCSMLMVLTFSWPVCLLAQGTNVRERQVELRSKQAEAKQKQKTMTERIKDFFKSRASSSNTADDAKSKIKEQKIKAKESQQRMKEQMRDAKEAQERMKRMSENLNPRR